MINKILLLFIAIVSLMSLVQGTTTYLEPEQCFDFKFQEGVYNETSMEIDLINRTETFCANSTLTGNACSVEKTLVNGEVFSRHSSACNLEISCLPNASLYDFEVPIFIEGEDDVIRITIGQETQSFPRILGYFNFDTTHTISCPSITEIQEGDPQSLRDCLAILKTTKDLTSEEREDYNFCINERDDFKVEWEKRGIELESNAEHVAGVQSDLAVCVEEKETSGLSVIFLIVIVIVLLIALAVFIMMRLKEGSSAANIFG